jgi:very-short-patch-repair endonuclease
MTGFSVPNPGKRAWDLAKRDHNVISYAELRALGYTRHAIQHRVRTGRLHPKAPRVYAVGSPNLTRYGRWMVAIKGCGSGAVLSHLSAAVLWSIWGKQGHQVQVTVPRSRRPRVRGVKLSRRDLPRGAVTTHHGIPVTTLVQTLIDLATVLHREHLEHAIGQADAKNLLRADALRAELEHRRGQRGVPVLVEILDRDAFVLTHSKLEWLFVPLALRAGLPKPRAQHQLGRHRVDFFFEELNLVVECDGLRYHRTQLQQEQDRRRDHAHLIAGRTVARFTHHQVAREPDYVVEVLRRLVTRAREERQQHGGQEDHQDAGRDHHLDLEEVAEDAHHEADAEQDQVRLRVGPELRVGELGELGHEGQ